MLELNKIYNMDCLEGMKLLPNECIDLTVTSPPYDNLRTYNGNIEQWSFAKFQAIAKELYRVTADGGVVVWIVADATIKGSETGTSFRQALWFLNCGFYLHDTMIYAKSSQPRQHNRYEQQFEYMFVFSKGVPKTTNLIRVPSKNAGKTVKRTCRDNNCDDLKETKNIVSETKIKSNIWEYGTKKNTTGHPAIFPEQLANDHIVSWSNEGDTVLDPFIGSGTTAIACINTNRNYIGFELDKQYCDIANERIRNRQRENQKGKRGLNHI